MFLAIKCIAFSTNAIPSLNIVDAFCNILFHCIIAGNSDWPQGYRAENPVAGVCSGYFLTNRCQLACCTALAYHRVLCKNV